MPGPASDHDAGSAVRTPDRVRWRRLDPDMGRIVPEFGPQFLRELIHPPFRIVYRREPKYVRIVRIRRSERLLRLTPGDDSSPRPNGERERLPSQHRFMTDRRRAPPDPRASRQPHRRVLRSSSHIRALPGIPCMGPEPRSIRIGARCADAQGTVDVVGRLSPPV